MKPINSTNDNVKPFAPTSGTDDSANPQISQRNNPEAKPITQIQEKSCAEPVLHVLKTCGRNDSVVRTAAQDPTSSVKSNIVFPFAIWHQLIHLNQHPETPDDRI